MSRTPVREALSRLQSSGLLEMASGGLVVAQLTRTQTLELYAVREILEGSAARLAAQHASPSEILSLKQICKVFERSLDDPTKLAHINRELHKAIYEAAHNRYLMRTLNELNDALALLPSTTFTAPGRPQAAVVEHEKIVAAVEARDAEAAESAARDHIRQAQDVRLAMMFDLG